MHTPSALKMASTTQAQDFIERFSFGVLVSGSLAGTHLPFVLKRDEGELGTLYGHFNRANPHWQSLEGEEALVIFSGPHAYISPTWYASAPAVPTWNYAAVHAYGRVRLLDGPATREAVHALVAFHEPALLDDREIMPADFEAKLLAAVVGFRVELCELQGKQKLGQHRRPDDQRGVYAALAASSRHEDRALADYMVEVMTGTGEAGSVDR